MNWRRIWRNSIKYKLFVYCLLNERRFVVLILKIMNIIEKNKYYKHKKINLD